jgi:hypothetical protein
MTMWDDDDIDRWITRHALGSNDVFDTLRRAMQLVSDDLNAEVARLTQENERLQNDWRISDANLTGELQVAQDRIRQLEAELEAMALVTDDNIVLKFEGEEEEDE